MTVAVAQHPWSSEALFNKALVYVGEMERYTVEDWQFGFWSSLSLELLARAALAHISPALLAGGKDWRNIYHALGHAPTKTGFTPVSINTLEVLSILNELLPEFTKELKDSCALQCGRRNAELHSGEGAFVGLGTSEWLPRFYASCDVFLRSVGKTLNDFFADATSANKLIAALRDTAARAVGQDIDAHRQIWKKKSDSDQKLAREQAAVWANRHAGHRVDCPACASPALIRGSGQGSVSTVISDDEVVQKQNMLPSSFECIACGLKISGLSKLSACGLGDAFIATTTLSPAEYFNLHTDEELDEVRARAESAEPEYEEDFNEYPPGAPVE
jgi:hypothetical protein